MAMLAEPRQRKRYNLVPRGKALYEDDDRFGTKMLEKMGWSKGKGLGANENGSKDFIRVRYKNDAQGLGFEDRDDQWTQHEQSFNGLLKTLNGESEEDNAPAQSNNAADSDEEMPTAGFGFAKTETKTKKEKAKLKEKISGVSLEEKSKHSKARVHYKKFTKGKDLAQYSEKDLANIFGKKAEDAQQSEANSLYAQFTPYNAFNSNDKEESDNEVVAKEEQESKVPESGVQIFNSELSVSDYFKQKMEALKRKRNNEAAIDEPVENVQPEHKKLKVDENAADDEANAVTVKKKKKKDKKEKEIEPEVVVNLDEMENNDKKQKSKKKKHSIQNDNDNSTETEQQKTENDNSIEIVETIAEAQDNIDKKKKSKKNKKDLCLETEKCCSTAEIEIAAKKQLKKSKKSKQVSIDLTEDVATANIVHDAAEANAEISKKKKKRSSKSKNETEEPANISIISIDDDENSNNTSVTAQQQLPAENNRSTANEGAAAHKKSKKKSSKKDVSESNSTAMRPAAEVLNDLIAKRDSYNVYTISSFCAEKFRFVDLSSFCGSTIAHISGYSYNENLTLNVENIPGDEARITKFWTSKADKYDKATPITAFQTYRNAVFKARKKHLKQPKFKVKAYKRKQAFCGVLSV